MTRSKSLYPVYASSILGERMDQKSKATINLGAAICSLVMVLTVEGTGLIMTHGRMTGDDKMALFFAGPITLAMAIGWLSDCLSSYKETISCST